MHFFFFIKRRKLVSSIGQKSTYACKQPFLVASSDRQLIVIGSSSIWSFPPTKMWLTLCCLVLFPQTVLLGVHKKKLILTSFKTFQSRQIIKVLDLVLLKFNPKPVNCNQMNEPVTKVHPCYQ